MQHAKLKIFLTPVLVFAGSLLSTGLIAQPPELDARIVSRFEASDAFQAVAVDAQYFYAISNTSITRHDKINGTVVGKLSKLPESAAKLVHLDSGVVWNNRLYAAHSNYPGWPMTSSVEVWNLSTGEHLRSHDFGVMLGSMTWLDRYEDTWWGTFANYDRVQRGMTEPYGETKNTVVVKFDEDFIVQETWTIPDEILRRMSPMSNSGGSWGADGHLYLSGHDDPEIYVMSLPSTGSQLDWVATILVADTAGQGIAWDRWESGSNILWAILRNTREVIKIEIPALDDSLE